MDMKVRVVKRDGCGVGLGGAGSKILRSQFGLFGECRNLSSAILS